MMGRNREAEKTLNNSLRRSKWRASQSRRNARTRPRAAAIAIPVLGAIVAAGINFWPREAPNQSAYFNVHLGYDVVTTYTPEGDRTIHVGHLLDQNEPFKTGFDPKAVIVGYDRRGNREYEEVPPVNGLEDSRLESMASTIGLNLVTTAIKDRQPDRKIYLPNS